MVNDLSLYSTDTVFVKARLSGCRAVLDHFQGLLDDNGLVQAPKGWNEKAAVYMGANWEWAEIINRLEPGKPLLLVLSKSDLFDQNGGWDRFLTRNKPEREIRPNAFRVLYFPNLSF